MSDTKMTNAELLKNEEALEKEVMKLEANEEVLPPLDKDATEVKETEGKKTITVDDLSLDDDRKEELLKTEELPKKEDLKESVEDGFYNLKQQMRKEERDKYRLMTHQEKIEYLDSKYNHEELIKRFIQNDELIPGKDRTIHSLKLQIKDMEVALSESAQIKELAVKYLKENEELKKVSSVKTGNPEAENAFIKKWGDKEDENAANPEFLKDVQEEIDRRVSSQVKILEEKYSSLEGKTNSLQNDSESHRMKTQENEFLNAFTNAVPDSAKLINTETYKDIYNSPIINLDENLSGFLVNQFGAKSYSTTGQVVDFLYNSKDVRAVNGLQAIFDYTRSIIKNINTPSKSDALKEQIQVTSNRGAGRPETSSNDMYVYKADFPDQLKKKLLRREITSEQFESFLKKYEEALLAGKVDLNK